MFTIRSNLAHTHQGLQAQLNDLLVENCPLKVLT